MVLRHRRQSEKTTYQGSANGAHQKIEGGAHTIIPAVPTPPARPGTRGVGAKVAVEVGLPDRAI